MKPIPCRCPAARYPHRPGSLSACEHNEQEYDDHERIERLLFDAAEARAANLETARAAQRWSIE